MMTGAFVPDKEQELYGLRNSLTYWVDREDTYSDRATRLRQLSDNIEMEIIPLPQVLTPIDRLHTTHTWEGNAATQSRTNLGHHHGRLEDAIGSLRGLIADLDAQAAESSGIASAASTHASRVRGSITALEREIELDRLIALTTW